MSSTTPSSTPPSLTIDCRSCVRQFSSSCADCVVTHLAPTAPDEAVVVDLATAAAMRRLERAGLVPGLRHRAG